MTEKKDSNKKRIPQGNVSEIPKKVLPEKITYDVDRLKSFIDFIFDAENLEDGENILAWKTSGMVPGYPSKSVDDFYSTLERSRKPAKLYYGTSTVGHIDGELRNRKAAFKQFYVLVLDDIGHKIPLDKIPPDFKPTYVIESSPNNFQYGYVLDEPITVLQEAETLVQLVYEGGFSDAGGKMATKLVRLPDGVNGKIGDNRDFRVNLKFLDENQLWSPSDILETLDIGVRWQDVVDDADKVMKERASKGAGASAWSPIKSELPALNGVIDPVAEWLYTTDQVKQESDEWLTIKCPWADTHTDGGDWASYSPMGWGDTAWRKSRTFHCFHDHCRAKKSHDFLDYVEAAGGPAAPVTERAYDLTSRYTFDPVNKGVWDITQPGQPGFFAIDAFNYRHPFKVKVPGTKTPIPETSLFKLAKNRVDVLGVTYDPTTIAKIVDNRGIQQINLYTQPEWGDGDYDEADISMFENFIEYLIPDAKSRAFYLDWLAAKAQDMAFRGPAILMIAQSQGTGRSTLANMIASLFGAENLERVPFERLSQGGGNFNDWIVKPIIVTDETLALGDETNFYKVYERLKELIDTTPQEVRVNPKFGRQRFQTTYSSFMLFSNHENAMKIAENDRRIYVLNNVARPAKPEYFVWLNEWIKKGAWMRSVWRWLRKREVDLSVLLSPPEKTKAKDDMLRASKQPVDVAMEALLESWPTSLIAFFQVKAILDSQQFKPRFRLLDEKRFDYQLQMAFKERTLTPEGAPDKIRVAGQPRRVKYISNHPGSPVYDASQITHNLSEFQLDSIKTAIDDALSEHDF